MIPIEKLANAVWVRKDGKYPAILPDGKAWTLDTDMSKFTDRQHAEYRETLEKINVISEEMGIDLIKSPKQWGERTLQSMLSSCHT